MNLNLTPKQKAWLKGAAVAVGSAVVSAGFQTIKAGGLPHSKSAWAAFVGTMLSVAGGAMHLYLKESPLSKAA